MKKESPTISFVIPVYKKPPEIFRKCLQSLFDMSFKEFEVICVFDGSDLDLQLVTTEFPSVKNFVIEHGGAPKARNKGLSEAKGEYVWFWDADCFIKPEHAKRMMDEFKAVPDADFVYSGYEFTEGLGTFDSEPFDHYSLQSGNFISSMAPIKREKAFPWDESLEGAQDWDYWLTAAEKGLKGVFVEGSGFVTDTVRTGLSSDKWSVNKRDATMLKIRRKHGIPERSIGVFTANYRSRAIEIAKILNADLIKPTGLTPTLYRTIFNLGYNFMSRFENLPEHIVKIQYWLPNEIEGLRSPEAKYKTVMETIRIAKTVINYCNTEYEKNKLAEMDIAAEVLPLPLSHEELKKVSTELPKDFSVLLATDENYAELLKEIQVDLPHIKFGFNAGKVADYSCFASFYQFAALDNAMLIALVNGRHVISNVQAPYCGFVDPDQTWENFKKDLYNKIHEVMNEPINKEAQHYYKTQVNPSEFIRVIHSHRAPVMEVVA